MNGELSQRTWSGHPVLSRLVRFVALAVPIGAAITTGSLVSRVWHPPIGFGAVVAWWSVVAAASTVVMVLVDRLARRLLPLAMLLKLSLVFPDRAPSRFAVAVRAGTVRSLDRLAERTRHGGRGGEPAEAAELALTLLAALNVHDRRTRGHSERVRAFNDLLAEELRLPREDRDKLRWAALLHDIGKLHVPTRLLNKPGSPTDEEWARLRAHPIEGAKLVAPLTLWLGSWADAVVEHHERWDGAGYPGGLSAEQISLGGRIVSVADAYEVMTAPRPYRRPVSAAAARAELANCAGTHFDPTVVRAFLNISLGRLRAVIGPVSWLAELPFLGSVPRLEAVAGSAARTALTAAGTATGVGALAVGATLGAGVAPATATATAARTHHRADRATFRTASGDLPSPIPASPSSPPGAAPLIASRWPAPVPPGLAALTRPNLPTSPAPAPTPDTTSADALVQRMKAGLESQPVDRSLNLISHLDAYLSAGRVDDKCTAMADFVAEVQGHMSDQILALKANSLLADATTVGTLLHCTRPR
jgi:putative nucleotidyltransferase with HDIG domain